MFQHGTENRVLRFNIKYRLKIRCALIEKSEQSLSSPDNSDNSMQGRFHAVLRAWFFQIRIVNITIRTEPIPRFSFKIQEKLVDFRVNHVIHPNH